MPEPGLSDVAGITDVDDRNVAPAQRSNHQNAIKIDNQEGHMECKPAPRQCIATRPVLNTPLAQIGLFGPIAPVVDSLGSNSSQNSTS